RAFEALVGRMCGQDFSPLWTVCHRGHAKDLTRTGAQNNLISREAFFLCNQLFELLVLSAGIAATFVECFGHCAARFFRRAIGILIAVEPGPYFHFFLIKWNGARRRDPSGASDAAAHC